MANHTIKNNQLRPEQTIWVRGKLTYSRVTKQIAGEELQADIERKRQNNLIPIEKPYTTATICNAQVLYRDPQVPTIEEKFIEERLFTSVKNPGYNCSAVNKGNRLPYIGYLENNQFIQIAPEGELANGLDVTLIIRVFKSSPQNGTTLDGIIVNEPIRYYSVATLGLEERGITMVPAPGYDNSASAHANDNTIAQPEAEMLNQPTQTPINQTPVNGNPYSATANSYNPAANPNPYQATPQQAQPVAQPQVQQTQPQANMYNPTQGNPVNMPTNIPQGQPQSGGIRYNPADRTY